jgi:hypothetical protein
VSELSLIRAPAERIRNLVRQPLNWQWLAGAIVRDTAATTDLRLFKFCDLGRVLKGYNTENWELVPDKFRKLGHEEHSC